MFRKFRKAVGCIIAAAVMTVVSVTASADYIYDLNNTDLLDEIKATDYTKLAHVYWHVIPVFVVIHIVPPVQFSDLIPDKISACNCHSRTSF